MTYSVLDAGLGYSTGDTIVSGSPMIHTGTVYFVGPDGDDTWDGLTEDSAMATFAVAYAAASAGDAIVLLDEYEETFTSTVTITTNDLLIVGAASSGGVPTAEFTYNSGSGEPFLIQGDRVVLANVTFKPKSQSNIRASLTIEGNDCLLRDVRVECGQYETVGLELTLVPYTAADWATCRLDGVTVVSTSTTSATRPATGLTTNTSQVSHVVMNGCVLDGGTVGFSTMAGDFSVAGGQFLRLHCESLSLLRGAVFGVHGSTVGYIQTPTVTGGGRVKRG